MTKKGFVFFVIFIVFSFLVIPSLVSIIQEGKKQVCAYDLSDDEEAPVEEGADIFKNTDFTPVLLPQYVSFFPEKTKILFYYVIATYNLRTVPEDFQPPELV